MRWLPEGALSKISRLEFLAHGAVDGFIAGRHKSARKGASVEFAEHRQYMPGDDLRLLDWKLVARSRRLYVREFVDETNLRATVVLDASGSMEYAGANSYEKLSKFDYARHVAALLSYLLVNQQDAVGFATYDTHLRNYIPAGGRPAQLKSVLELVDSLKCGGDTHTAEVLHEIAERIPRRGVVFILSDFFNDLSSLVKALYHLRYRRHEVFALQIVAEEELTFPFTRLNRFEDLESRALLDVDTRAIRADYIKRFNDHCSEFKRICGEMRITNETLVTNLPFDEALADLLVRNRRGGVH